MAGDQTIGDTTPIANDRPGPVGEVGPAGPDSTVVGPEGDQGPTGDQGPIGDTGDQGPQGDTGVTGIDGLKGITGLKGLTGDTGIQGIKGNTGIQGPTGLAQRLLTDIQFYNDGFVATYSDRYVSECAWEKDIEGRVTLLTNSDNVTTLGYNTGNRP